MIKIIVSVFSSISFLGFSQNVDQEKLEQLSNSLSEETCNCVQKSDKEDGLWMDAIFECYLTSFKRNDLKLKQIIGADYLQEEKASYIYFLLKDAEKFWTNVCSQKLNLIEEAWSPSFIIDFYSKEVLKYDIFSYSIKVESEIPFEDIEFDVFYVKTFKDEENDIHIVVKDDTNKIYDLVAFNSINNFLPKLENNQINANQKIKIIVREFEFTDEKSGKKINVQLIIDLQEI